MAIGCPQRQHVAWPDVTSGSYCLRSCWCGLPYPRWVVVPRLLSRAVLHVSQRPLSCLVSALVGQGPRLPMQGRGLRGGGMR